MKSVMQHLPKGTLFNFSSFQRSVRAKQVSEDTYGVHSPMRKRGYDKYETEVQIAGTVLIKKGFTISEQTDLEHFSTELFKIHQIYEENLEKYFKLRVKGVQTTSLKIKKVNFTLVEQKRSESIEALTKDEIIQTVIKLLETSALDGDEINDIKAATTRSKSKQFLINIYNEIIEDQIQEGLGLTVET